MRLVTFCLLVLAAGAASPDTGDTGPVEDWSFTFIFENDLFGDTDQHYTNGIKLSWTSPDLRHYRDSDKVPRWVHPYIERLLFFDSPMAEHDPLVQRNIVFSIGQTIFTPQDIAAFDLVEDDRPYAGWLYGGLAFRKRDPGTLDTLELQLGIIGPLSGAEQTQSLVHDLRDLQTPNGWEHQLDTEPTIGVVYERKWRFFERRREEGGLGLDFIPHAGGALGNAYIFANLGAELRVGWNVPPDFGDPIVRPGGVTSPPIVWTGERAFRLYAFAYVDGRAVGRDITLDGNTFGSSHSVDKRHFVADLAAGLSMTVGRAKVTLTRVVRTREFEGQDDEHHFGSISLSYTF